MSKVWVSAHVHYHDDLDDLLVRAVGPLVRDLRARGEATRWFFLRYWNGGPHLRLRIHAPAGAEAAVRATIDQRIRAYLTRFPSTTTMSAEDYTARAGELADWEQVAVLPPVPNNTLRFTPYEPEHRRYGTGDALAAVEQHFAESSTLALRVLSAGCDHERRLALAVSVVGAGGGLGLFPRSLASSLTDHCEAAYDLHRETLLRMLRRGSGVTTAWRASTARLRAAAPDAGPAVLDACAHLFCNRLGLSAADEFYVRYLAGRAAADLQPTPILAGDP